MKFILPFLLLSTLSVVGQDSSKEAWESMFNGKDLTGWTPKIRYAASGDNVKNTFRVLDGKLAVSYDKYDSFNEQFGHLFYNKKFSYYRIKLQYRFIGDQAKEGPGWAYRNSGIMIHGQSHEKPQIGGGNVSGQDIIYGSEGQLLTEGSISLQSESHPVEFKSIEILNLEGCMDSAASNYKTYYIKSKPSDCRYSNK